MDKTKKNKDAEAGKQADKPGKPSRRPYFSDKKLKRDSKAKEDHLKHIPFRLREIMKSKEQMTMGSREKKKLKNALITKSMQKGTDDGDIAVPRFKKGKTESVPAYFHRMELETKHVLFLTNNQVDRKPELDVDKQGQPIETSNKSVKSEKKKEHDKDRLLRIQEKKLNIQVAKMEKEMFRDNVVFGEVAMAPPALIKPRNAPVKSQSSKDLLLNSLLGHATPSTDKPSMARRRIVEEERARAVEAYRHLKKQKQHEAQTASLEKLKNLQ